MLLEKAERPSPFQGRWLKVVSDDKLLSPGLHALVLRLNDAYAPCMPQFLDLFPSNTGATSVHCPPTVMIMHLRSVEKRISIPTSHLQGLLDVYGLLSSGNIPGAITCEKLRVRLGCKWNKNDILFAGYPLILGSWVD